MADIRSKEGTGFAGDNFYPGTDSAVIDPEAVRTALTRSSDGEGAPREGDPVTGLRYALLGGAVLWAVIILIGRMILSV